MCIVNHLCARGRGFFHISIFWNRELDRFKCVLKKRESDLGVSRQAKSKLHNNDIFLY